MNHKLWAALREALQRNNLLSEAAKVQRQQMKDRQF